LTENLEEIGVSEQLVTSFEALNHNVHVIKSQVIGVDTTTKIIKLQDQKEIRYTKLCICSGARPNLVLNSPNVIGIRDLQSVTDMRSRLEEARAVVVLGNGGIALELVDSLDFCGVHWVMRDDFIGNTFFDSSASAFIMPNLLRRTQRSTESSGEGGCNGGMMSSTSAIINANAEGVVMSSGEDGPFLANHDHPQVETCLATVDVNVDGAADVAVVFADGDNSNARSQFEQDAVGDKLVVITEPTVPLAVATISGALGPDWVERSGGLRPKAAVQSQSGRGTDGHEPALRLIFGQEVRALYDSSQSKSVGGAAAYWMTVDPLCILSPRELETCTAAAVDPVFKEWPLLVLTSAGMVIGCDFLVSATGVAPLLDFVGSEFLRSTSAGDSCGNALVVDSMMRTSVADVFAAGDCCHVSSCSDFSRSATGCHAAEMSPHSVPGIDEHTGASCLEQSEIGEHWFQMRLWSQARAMGNLAANVMFHEAMSEAAAGEESTEILLPSPFLLFTHVTRFFGYKVVLLGRYNAQGIGEDLEKIVKGIVVTPAGLIRSESAVSVAQGREAVQDAAALLYVPDDDSKPSYSHKQSEVEVWSRVSPGVEYVKVVVRRGKVVGAMLIGDTDLEEVFENLILNELDVGGIGIDMLDPDVDVEDYFD